MMDTPVPPEITAELTQILSNLVLGDNQIRSSAENAVNERLAHTPELYILALAQFAIAADSQVMRSFSLVLLRRLLFRVDASTSSSNPPTQPLLMLYDRLSTSTLSSLDRLLLHSLLNESNGTVRRASVTTVCELANAAMERGRPWHALQSQAFSMAQDEDIGRRESAFGVFAECPLLVADLATEQVIAMFERGLNDSHSIDVRHAALRAAVSYLENSDAPQIAQSLSLMHSMLNTLPFLLSLSPSSPVVPENSQVQISPSESYKHLAAFISTLTPLASSHPTLFAPHLTNLLSFIPPLILPPVDAGPTPTVANPKSFTFPPPASSSSSTNLDSQEGERDNTRHDELEEKETARKSALELMITLSEAKPSMVRKVDGWVSIIVRTCLQGMEEIDTSAEDEEESLKTWLEEDPADEDSDATYPFVYEQSLDRLSIALSASSSSSSMVLGAAFQYIPSMLASYDWRVRHAGLMAIAAVAEGGSQVMKSELDRVINYVTPMFSDSHPRVRYAACQCVGQLCTDLEEIIQEKYHSQLFSALISTLEAPEPRVHAHAAAALINFCEGVERDTLIPYLDPIVERLLKLLHSATDESGSIKRYVQEQAITTLAMVADASETTFTKHYATIMPLLLNVLRNAEGAEYRKLRVKAMECAGLIAIAVGRDVFRPDSSTLVELLIRIQNSPQDPGDALLPHYLIATWAKLCQALGPEFEPYLHVVMPPLLTAANAKADVSVYDEDEEANREREGWETLTLDGHTVGIRTSSIEEKCQAFETLVIYSSTLGGRFAPYLSQTLELTLPSLRFHFHEGVREACAMLIPILLSCGKSSNTLTTQMVEATFRQLIVCIRLEKDASFLASLYKAFTDSLRVVGGPAIALTQETHEAVIEATKHQLQSIADRRKRRTQRPAEEFEDEREDFALLEEMEDFALEDMAKMLTFFDANHPLLVAVASVRELGLSQWDGTEEDDS